ncbi:hypothetical protein VKT23_010815 [Stygiomarasmius scandens]|uniref:HD domain-containing protein n=1 Tax=Marasmiellus scandens TaxID=2682957 RepID=A0ABR1JB81_9AGAR
MFMPGVAHIARVLVEHLRRQQPELGITDRDIESVQIAGLCHDLGHGPWSHFWDGVFIPKAFPGSDWTHERGSEEMFKYLISDNNIRMNEDDAEFIMALIAGDHKRTPKEKKFLFDVVANRESGLDVDKFEYIQRDSHMLGDPIKINISRILESARVIDDHICFDWKDLSKIYNIFESRFHLHERYYNHKTAKAIEYMLLDALLFAEPTLHFAKNIENPTQYLHLTDSIMQFIQHSKDESLIKAQNIFSRIECRDLYKCVDQQFIEWRSRDLVKEVTKEKIVNACKKIYGESPPQAFPDINIDELESAHVIVDQTPIHYGKGELNPIDFVNFYSRNDLSELFIRSIFIVLIIVVAKCIKALPGQYSTVKPRHFAEIILRVYTKEPQYFAIVQRGYRHVMASLDFPIDATQPVPHNLTIRDSESLSLAEKTSSYIENPFTKVPSVYVPLSLARARTTKVSSTGQATGSSPESPSRKRKIDDEETEKGNDSEGDIEGKKPRH